MHAPRKNTSVRRSRVAELLILMAGFGLVSAQAVGQDGSAEAGSEKVALCSACHGMDGNSIAPNWPSLAGQHENYTARQLQAYRDGARTDATMASTVTGLSEQDMADIAAYFAEQRLDPKGADPALVERGERIYRGGIPERGVAACIACHGPSGKGNKLSGYPRVSHQHATYLANTLRDYRSGQRRSDVGQNQMMRNIAELLLDDEIEALANYMQGLN